MKGKKFFSDLIWQGFSQTLLFFLMVIMLFSPNLHGQIKRDDDEQNNLEAALKVVDFLEQAASYHQKTGKFQGKKAEFTEKELSAFFQEVLLNEVPAFKRITLKLFPGNRVEGWVVLNFKGMDIPSYMKEELNLYFSAVAELNQRKIRLNFESLFLEGQKIQLAAVNALIEMVAKSRDLEVKRLDSWYDLPAGILNLSTKSGQIIVKY